jgi:hypothetical protein
VVFTEVLKDYGDKRMKYLLEMEVDKNRLDEIFERLNKAKQEIYECYSELQQLGVLKMASGDSRKEILQNEVKTQLPPYKCIHTPEEREKLAHDGERVHLVCSAHNDALAYTLYLLNSIIPNLEDLVYHKKRFRAEIYFDPEADKFDFLTFTAEADNGTAQEG